MTISSSLTICSLFKIGSVLVLEIINVIIEMIMSCDRENFWKSKNNILQVQVRGALNVMWILKQKSEDMESRFNCKSLVSSCTKKSNRLLKVVGTAICRIINKLTSLIGISCVV